MTNQLSVPEGAEPQRIVSLVPSLTEALFALGLGDRVVGITDWCIYPADAVSRLPKLGGTKNPDVPRLLAMKPDLVIANHEENTERVVEAIREQGIAVWVTYPRTADEGARLLRDMAALGADDEAVEAVVVPVEEAVSRARREFNGERTRFFCPIWRDPWMSVGADTFAHSILELCGGHNVFAEREERRYPIVTLDELVDVQPEVIILPDEPYDFGPSDVEELAALPIPAARNGRIHPIDGTAVTWYGPRIAQAIDTLRPLLGKKSRIVG